MIKNRIAQIVFQTSFCAIGIIGVIASLGIFDYTFRSDFYVHFTNLSNYLCIIIMFAELIQSIKNIKRNNIAVQILLTKLNNII